MDHAQPSSIKETPEPCSNKDKPEAEVLAEAIWSVSGPSQFPHWHTLFRQVQHTQAYSCFCTHCSNAL